MFFRILLPTMLIIAQCQLPAASAADPTDNPVATFYSGPEGYPAWTDGVHWERTINMKTYNKGKTTYDKFLRARAELSEGGGVMYYPAGTYDFSTMPPGVPLTLNPGVFIRGESPNGHPMAGDGKLELPTKFIFAFRERGPGKVPRDFNFIGLQPDDRKSIKTIEQVGIAWVHIVGATINFGPELDWGKTWGNAGALFSDKVKGPWTKRDPCGTHPFDALAGAGKKYVGAGKRRLVFGCVLEDSAVLDDYSDPGYGPDGFQASPHCARIIAYGGRVFVANNLLPRSRKNFKYRQTTSAGAKANTVMFDYGRTCGIDVNKELLVAAHADGACKGYFEEGVVVRDNYVFNHGHKGYSIAGSWVSVTGNKNERIFLKHNEDVYGLGPGAALTVDGYEISGAKSDNRSRAFELSGRNLWVDGNRFNNTGSTPGKDGEGIIGRDADGTPAFSWAITHNTHIKGAGAAAPIGGADLDCHGLLIGWNTTAGWVGNLADRPSVKMIDCAFIGNKCDRIVPDVKTVKKLGLPAPLTAAPAETPPAPGQPTVLPYRNDAVKITWSGLSDKAVGYRVERRIGNSKWHIIAYRPPQFQVDPDNPAMWIDFTAPTAQEMTYRVVALDADDSDKGAGQTSLPITLNK